MTAFPTVQPTHSLDTTLHHLTPCYSTTRYPLRHRRFLFVCYLHLATLSVVVLFPPPDQGLPFRDYIMQPKRIFVRVNFFSTKGWASTNKNIPTGWFGRIDSFFCPILGNRKVQYLALLMVSAKSPSHIWFTREYFREDLRPCFMNFKFYADSRYTLKKLSKWVATFSPTRKLKISSSQQNSKSVNTAQITPAATSRYGCSSSAHSL